MMLMLGDDQYSDTKLPTPHPLFLFFSFFFFFCLFMAAPMVHRGSQPRGPIGAAAAGLCHSHSNMGSEQCLRPTPQLTAMLDP